MTPDPPPWWQAVHDQYDGGSMDGFFCVSQQFIGDGNAAIGYYTASELPFLPQPVPGLRALRELLLLGARSDLAEPLLPHVRDVRRDHDQRAVGYGIFDSTTWPIILDSSTTPG